LPDRLLVVSNRLPLTVEMRDGAPHLCGSSGGLATGMRAPHARMGGLWIGWPGRLTAYSDEQRASIHAQLETARAVAVELDDEEQRVFYDHLCNEVLWPLCHDRLDQLPLRIDGWDVYDRVNQRFADRTAARYRAGDTVWVHDYQLMRAPALLRRSLPDARIGYFYHIPFPNPELFLALPTRRHLVEGMLGADVIGFHTRRYRGHFTAVLRRQFGLEMSRDETVEWEGRRVRLLVLPMSVDARDFAARAATPAVSAERLAIRRDTPRLLVGIDRLDYTKGIPRRLLAFERLLEQNPQWLERIRLVQVAVPSRGDVDAYQRYRQEVEALVGRINGRFSTPTWTPVHYMYRSVADEVLLGLYRAADVMLVTPVRDGLNLVSKEFVASRVDEDGVLLLSEFAGAAEELGDALIVNPYDVDGMATLMHTALVMPSTERRRRMRLLRARVFEHDVHAWADGFLRVLHELRP
jgi:trehalose 6-phosphate synthase/phosphatase